MIDFKKGISNLSEGEDEQLCIHSLGARNNPEKIFQSINQ
jgi:hypothetical protein